MKTLGVNTSANATIATATIIARTVNRNCGSRIAEPRRGGRRRDHFGSGATGSQGERTMNRGSCSVNQDR